MILINILMIIFALLLLGIGSYLFNHRHKDFLIFHPTNNLLLSSTARNFGIIFIAIGIITIITIFSQKTTIMCIALILGCIAVAAFYLCIGKFIK